MTGHRESVDGHLVVARVAALARDLLAPTAAQSDAEGVPRSHLDALAGAGAFAIACPTAVGGSQAPAAVNREVVESIAGACGTTWFCFAQHKTPTNELLASDNEPLRRQWLPRLATGDALASVAFAHLRRPRQTFGMTRIDGGWRLDGGLDWVTGWPISDVCLIQGIERAADGRQLDQRAADGRPVDRVVSVLIGPPRPDPARAAGLTAGPALPLAAMGGTHTWPVTFDGYQVGDEQVVSIRPLAEWQAANDRLAANTNPATFGMAQASVAELAAIGERTGQASVSAAAQQLDEQLVLMRTRAYELADAAAADDAAADATLTERTRLRAHALDLNARAATALIAAQGGTAMLLTAAAQRRAREALFLMVQGQTRELRDEALRTAVH